VPAELKVWEALPPGLMVPVEKLPPFPVALWGACPELCHVTVSPTAIVTDAGEKKKSPALTLADAAACALGFGLETVTAGGGGASAVVVTASLAGATGSGVVVVVVVGGAVVGVVAVVVVPASWAADTAGTAQIAARTSIPLARALAPFTFRILRGIDS
jgi:hypothetical protein